MNVMNAGTALPGTYPVPGGRYIEQAAKKEPVADTLTLRSNRICAQSARIVNMLDELMSRIVLDIGEANDKAQPPDPTHAQSCLALAESRLSAVEDRISSLLTRI